MTVMYEWDIEILNDRVWQDIVDHEWMAKLSECTPADVGELRRLVLVRSQGSDATGLETRSYAYPKLVDNEWVLPPVFDTGHPVPKRFPQELEAWNGQA